MKTLFFLGALTFSCSGFTQGVVQLTDIQVLYLVYANRIEIGIPKTEGSYSVFAEGATIEKHDTFYTVFVKDVRHATIGVKNEKGDTIGKQEYICRRLPDFQLFWGSAGNGESLIDYTAPLRAGYPDLVYLTFDFTVISYEVQFSGSVEVIEVQGNVISPKVIEHLKNATSQTEISIVARVLGPDGIKRIRASTFVYEPI